MAIALWIASYAYLLLRIGGVNGVNDGKRGNKRLTECFPTRNAILAKERGLSHQCSGQKRDKKRNQRLGIRRQTVDQCAKSASSHCPRESNLSSTEGKGIKRLTLSDCRPRLRGCWGQGICRAWCTW